MNTTLKPATNLILCAVWIVLIVLSFSLPPVRLEIGIVSGALGVVAGFLQSRALRENAAKFGQTASMMDVRRVITSSVGGKVSIWLLWVNLVVFMVWSFKSHSIGSMLLGFGAFKLARDLITLPGVFRLGRAAGSSQAS
jgi:hypothetical protein